MDLSEYASLDATALAEAVARGEVAPGELEALAREGIARTNPALNFLVAEIDEAVEGDPSGPFGGVPFVVKDLVMQVRGVPHAMGTRALDGDVFVPSESSVLLERFAAAGLRSVARTTTPEFGFNGTTEPVANGPTRNPWDVRHSSGGSSGGTAAAVAAGVVPVGHANDGGGSIRIPAASCGLVGLKPSRGRTPTGPTFQNPLGGMGIEFALARTVRDAARLLDAVCGPETASFVALPRPETPFARAIEGAARPLRIALAPRGFEGQGEIHPGLRELVSSAGRLLEGMGHRVEDIGAVPFVGAAFHTANFRYWMASCAAGVHGLAAQMGFEPGEDRFERCTLRSAEEGMRLTALQMEEAQLIMAAVSRHLGAFMQERDALILPPFARPPPRLGVLDQNHPDWSARTYYEALFDAFPTTAPFNMTGQPAIAVPTGPVDGLPCGVQIAAPMGREDTLLALARQLEEEVRWTDRRPEIHVSKGGGAAP